MHWRAGVRHVCVQRRDAHVLVQRHVDGGGDRVHAGGAAYGPGHLQLSHPGRPLPPLPLPRAPRQAAHLPGPPPHPPFICPCTPPLFPKGVRLTFLVHPCTHSPPRLNSACPFLKVCLCLHVQTLLASISPRTPISCDPACWRVHLQLCPLRFLLVSRRKQTDA